MRIRTLAAATALSLVIAGPAALASPAAFHGAASTSAVNPSALEAPPAAETFTVGTLRVQRYGDHGRPLILIPGLAGGSWVWRGQIEHFRSDHVIYAVTLAGFDGLPMPKDHTHLIGQADASLLKLIQSRHIDKPVLIGHSLGGTLSIRFAEEHSDLIAGVIAVDGLPVLPPGDRLTSAQRKAGAEKMYDAMVKATPQQYRAQTLRYMQYMGTIDPAKAARYAPFNARSDQAAVAEYLKEDAGGDDRPGLKNIRVPLLEISPYYQPDFSKPPMQFTETQKADYYKRILAGDPTAKVVSIAPSRHFVMLDQPQKLDQAIAKFLKRL